MVVEGAAELAFELLGGVLEGVFEWLAGGGADSGQPSEAERGRYVEALYEERRPLPPGLWPAVHAGASGVDGITDPK